MSQPSSPASRQRVSAKVQRGYSLIELSIAMAIASVVIVGSVVGVQRILANNRANNMLQTVARTNSVIIGATSNNVLRANGISTAQAIQLGVFPAPMVAGSGNARTVNNEFGGNYVVSANLTAVGNTPVSSGYFVGITNVPGVMCPTVINGLANLADGIWVGDNQLAVPALTAARSGTPATANQVEAPGGAFALDVMASQCDGENRTIMAFMPVL